MPIFSEQELFLTLASLSIEKPRPLDNIKYYDLSKLETLIKLNIALSRLRAVEVKDFQAIASLCFIICLYSVHRQPPDRLTPPRIGEI